MDSLSDMGLSFSVQFPPFWVSVLCSSSVSSALIGEPQNLLAKDEDLYGADLHRVNSKAFFGGEEEEEETKALAFLSYSWSSSSSPSETSIPSPNFDSIFGASSLISPFLQKTT